MMKCWCITNGWTGETYVRAYAWAETVEHAQALYEARHGVNTATGLKIVELFAADAAPFVTALSDSGFDDKEY